MRTTDRLATAGHRLAMDPAEALQIYHDRLAHFEYELSLAELAPDAFVRAFYEVSGLRTQPDLYRTRLGSRFVVARVAAESIAAVHDAPAAVEWLQSPMQSRGLSNRLGYVTKTEVEVLLGDESLLTRELEITLADESYPAVS